MKNNNTTTKTTKSFTSHARFNFLKSMYHQAPLPKAEFEELKILAKKYNPKMADYLEKNPELC